jgi:DNA-binding XRE family transcriptional regulator
MRLKEYLSKTKMKQARFAEQVGTTRANLCQLVAGQHVPSLDLALRIQVASGGLVTVADWSRAAARR